MKRYWKIISICIAIVIVIGTFYLQSSLAANEKIKIELDKISGNGDEVKNLVLYGDYETGNLHQSFIQISNKETINLSTQSPLQRLTRFNAPVFKDLMKHHRNFMRGKNLMPHNFYEDENIIAYANIDRKNPYDSIGTFYFDINVLNKKSGESTKFKLDLTNKGNYNWLDNVEVQVLDGKLNVFTRGVRTDGGDELSVYTIDIDEQKLVEKESIISAPTIDNGWTDIVIFNNYSSMKSERYLFIKMETYKDMHEGNGETVQHPDAGPEIVSNEVIIYNMENNQSKKLQVPDEMLGALDYSTIYGSTLYIPSQTEGGFEISQYDIEKDQWGDKVRFDFPEMKNHSEDPYMELMNGKIYIIYLEDNERKIFVGDLTTGKSLYEGKIKVNKTGGTKTYDRLYIQDLEYVQ